MHEETYWAAELAADDEQQVCDLKALRLCIRRGAHQRQQLAVRLLRRLRCSGIAGGACLSIRECYWKEV